MDKLDVLLWKLARLIVDVGDELSDYSKHLAEELNKSDEDFDSTQADYWARRRNGVRRELDDLCELVGVPRSLVVMAVDDHRKKNKLDEAFIVIRNFIDSGLNLTHLLTERGNYHEV